MQFDQVLCLTACAVQRLVDVFGRSGRYAGDDEADVEALRGGLDPSTGTAVSFPCFGSITGFGEAAQAGFLVERSPGANIVGGLIDSAVECDVAGEAKDEVDAVLVAPFHDLLAAIMPVAPDGEPSLWPVPPDAADQAAQMTANLETPLASCRGAEARRLAGSSPCRKRGLAGNSARRNGR